MVPCVGSQPSARTGSHTAHIAPTVPQAPSESVWHPAAEQQPLGQEVASQLAHAPAIQVWPVLQASPLPQAQPRAEQLSARTLLHVAQAAPGAAQRVIPDNVRQLPDWQQPVGQEVASQVRQLPPWQK
jgi:hypothetical protein